MKFEIEEHDIQSTVLPTVEIKNELCEENVPLQPLTQLKEHMENKNFSLDER